MWDLRWKRAGGLGGTEAPCGWRIVSTRQCWEGVVEMGRSLFMQQSVGHPNESAFQAE